MAACLLPEFPRLILLSRMLTGVVPGLARDAHASAIEEVVKEALEKANVTEDQLDAVAVTMGPGLEICLRVGFHQVCSPSCPVRTDD